MRKLILAATAAAVALPLAATPADAQRGRNERQESRECAARTAQCRQPPRISSRTPRMRPRNQPGPPRGLAQLQSLRLEPPGPRGAYYADDYYRDGRYYRTRALSRNDRIYRGRDGRYYCRRNDGTTGLIIGAGIGALIGNSIDDGRSSLLGTLIGAGAGAAIGREIDRGARVSCR